MRACTQSPLALALVLAAAPGRAAADPAAPPVAGRYIAGKLVSENSLVIERIGPDGAATEVFRGGTPTAWRWLDAHTLVELFDDGGRGDAVIAAIVDGKPDPQHAIKLDNTAWPPEALAWSQYLAVHQGQLWLVREPGPDRKASNSGKGGKAARPTKGAKPAPVPAGPAGPAVPAKPVYQRVDVKPPVIQREPPADGVAARDDGRTWLDGLPSVQAPAGLAVTRTKVRIGRRNLGALRCKPAKGAMTSFPTRTTQPLQQLDVGAVRFVSPTLPLYIAGGMADRPDGPAFGTAAFLGCTNEPLQALAWGGGDVFLTVAGAPGGARAKAAAGDRRKMQLWVDGRTVANLAVLVNPMLSPVEAAKTGR